MRKYLPSLFASLGVLLAVGVVFNVQAAAATHVVISEVQIGSELGTNNDFIELYNPTGSPIDLNGFRLVKRTAAGTSDSSVKAWDSETIIPANSYYLWANSGWTPGVFADATTSATLAANNGIALRQGPVDTGTVIDSVGWGTASNAFVEGNVFPENPINDSSIERKACGNSTSESMVGSDATNANSEDTDNNANDFVIRTTSGPQNSQSAIETSGCAGGTPTASPTASPTVSPTPTLSPTPTATPVVTPTPTVTPSSSPTATPTLSPTPTPTPVPTPTVTASPTPSLTPSPTMSPSPTASPMPFPFHNFSCKVTYRIFKFRFWTFVVPQIHCGFGI